MTSNSVAISTFLSTLSSIRLRDANKIDPMMSQQNLEHPIETKKMAGPKHTAQQLMQIAMEKRTVNAIPFL